MLSISVIIPAYNQAQYLAIAIQSVLDQTFDDYEIIVIDDGSTDNTREIAQSFGEKIRYICQTNKGLAGARNAGIVQATGEYIALLDSDDQWLPNHLNTLITLTKQHSTASVFYSGARYIDAKGHHLPQLTGNHAVLPSDNIYEALLEANFIIPSTAMLRRKVASEVGLFDECPAIKGCEDWDIWLRLAKQGYKFVGASECTIHYRLHGSSLSANPTKMQNAALSVIEKHFGPDGGQPQSWSSDKRRAYGGVYRYHGITSIIRQGDWLSCALFLQKAFQIDPTLADDLDLFYELALGSQPLGYRGTIYHLDLKNNEAHLTTLLAEIFHQPFFNRLDFLCRRSFGSAYYALGLIAYNLGYYSLSWQYLILSLKFKPILLSNPQIIKTILKSFIK